MTRSALRLKYALLGASMIVIGSSRMALAQTAPPGEPTEVKGTVLKYSLTPRGNVDGLIMTDGTEVRLPPHAQTQMVFAVRPGDAVTIQGVKTVANPVVTAVSLTNDATGAVVDTRPPGPPSRSMTRVGSSCNFTVQTAVSMASCSRTALSSACRRPMPSRTPPDLPSVSLFMPAETA